MSSHIHIGLIGNIANKSEREKYIGVLRYAVTQQNIVIEEFNPIPFPADVSRRLIERWRPDGIIVSSPLDPAHGEILPDGIPTVLIDDFDQKKSMRDIRHVLLPDESSLARTVAHHYLRRNFRSFAYFGYADKKRSLLREREFARVVTGEGHAVSSFGASWSSGRILDEMDAQRLHKFIKELAFPCAAFVYWDYLAKRVIAACSELGIKIPGQLSVIGVDNEEFICENTRPTLSSVELDFQSVGYKAAERLHGILSGKNARRPFREIAYGITKIVERASSSDLDGTARILTAAREIIRTQACHGLTASALARQLNISQRYLEMHFKNALGTSPCSEIRKRKLEEAKRLLVQTQMPLNSIAGQSGFHTLHHLQNIFSENAGCSMKTFRARNRPNAAIQKPSHAGASGRH